LVNLTRKLPAESERCRNPAFRELGFLDASRPANRARLGPTAINALGAALAIVKAVHL
jgi:hypothetical protein